MYWRGIPHFDPDQFATVELFRKRNAADNALLPVLFDVVKYLAITAAIYMILATVLSVVGAGMSFL